MKDKNKRLYILVSILLIGVGLTFAYFVGKTIFKGTGATTEGRTATVNGSTLDISGNIEFGDKDIYPGHQTLSKVIATATGNNELIAYNLTWIGTNNLNTNLKYKVYVSEEEKEISLTCEKKKKVVNGAQQLNEVCIINGELGEPINEGEIPSKPKEEQTIKITNTEFITSKKTGTIKYYYIIVEYPDNGDQSIDIGEGFEGKVYGEISNTKADINIISVNVEGEDGKYTKQSEIPKQDSNLTLNTSDSHCTNDATLEWDNSDRSLIVNNLTQSGTDCELYFYEPTPEKTLKKLGISESDGVITDITGPSCSGSTSSSCYSGDSSHKNMAQNGIYDTVDDYGKSYVYRGFVQNNWLKFGKENGQDIWWRIIRINGNGTIRLIYAGKGSTAPSTTTADTQIGTSAYNTNYNDNKYVGFMFGTASNGSASSEGTAGTTDGARNGTKPAHLNKYDSTIKDKLDAWWVTTNLGDTDQVKHIDIETGFCNDREPVKSAHGSYGTTTYGKTQAGYAPADRVWQSGSTSYDSTQEPTLKCGDDTSRQYDLFTGTDAKGVMVDGKTIAGNHALTNPVGLITMDEVIYAGGFAGANNNNYWLYTGQYYWTMSPSCFYNSGSSQYARVFIVTTDGNLNDPNVNSSSIGVRPVINLKADTVIDTLRGGDLANGGTTDNPYIVK